MIRAAAGIGLAACLVGAMACGGGNDKPPLTPDGPDMTQPVGDDAGAVLPASPAIEGAPNAPSSGKGGGIESQTTIGR